MRKKALILGATGMAGQAFEIQLNRDGYSVVGASRHGPDARVDLSERKEVLELIHQVHPNLVVNCAAIVSLSDCEINPVYARVINSLLVDWVQESCATLSADLIHISTDHFYEGRGPALHSETDPVKAFNAYADTKLEAERYALRNPSSLVIRTNIAGFRGDLARPTYAEWLFDSIDKRAELTLFDDYFSSTLDVSSMCQIVLQLYNVGAHGVFNVASSGSISKLQFAQQVSREMGILLDWPRIGSAESLMPKRSLSNGLACNKAEQLLKLKMPTTEEVVARLHKEWRRYRIS